MAPDYGGVNELPVDILLVIFQQFVGDYASLCNVSLTCRAWRTLSLPCLLQIVDLSSHNNGRLRECESSVLRRVYADFGAQYRPRNLVPRQRAFRRLMTAKPDLAMQVRSLSWTLIWMDFDDTTLTDIDRQTWNVFSRMNNVTRLDLASLHEIYDEDLVRQNPAKLFPAVIDLRLLGWMHRGLVKAIVTSLDSSRVRSLKLDYMQDEGSLPSGAPLDCDLAQQYAHHARKTHWEIDRLDVIDDELFRRQEAGEACIFPGPMWLPLRLLSARPLESLTHLEVELAPFHNETDLRSYTTLFRETADLIVKVKDSLKSLVVVFGEYIHCYKSYSFQCGTSRLYMKYTFRPWCIKMAVAFLSRLLAALRQTPFPHLGSITFGGFYILETASPKEAADAGLSDIFRSIRECSFANASFTQIKSIDRRHTFYGIECPLPDDIRLDRLEDILESS